MVAKKDPIRDKYFAPLEIAEKVSGFLFLISVLASFSILVIDSRTQAGLYAFVQIVFALAVLFFFVTEATLRLYFGPRSQRKRYEDFLAHAFGKQLSPAQTAGYYNSDASEIPKRIAAQLLENSFYSLDTSSEMVKYTRVKIALYIIVFAILLLNRSSDLGIIGLAVQVVFSEQIISYWLRLEWLRHEFEKVHDEMFRLLSNNLDLELPTQEMLGRYEMAKSNAGITLSEKIFKRRQERTDAEWNEMRATLGI